MHGDEEQITHPDLAKRLMYRLLNEQGDTGRWGPNKSRRRWVASSSIAELRMHRAIRRMVENPTQKGRKKTKIPLIQLSSAWLSIGVAK